MLVTAQVATLARAGSDLSQKLLPQGCRSPGTWAILHCFARRINRELEEKMSTAIAKTKVPVGWQQ